MRCAAAGSGVGQGPRRHTCSHVTITMRPLARGAGARPPASGPGVAQWDMPMTMLCFWRLGGGAQRGGPGVLKSRGMARAVFKLRVTAGTV